MSRSARTAGRRSFVRKLLALAGASVPWTSVNTGRAASPPKPQPKPPAFRGSSPAVVASVADGLAWKPYYSIGTPGAVGSIVSAWNGAAFDYATSTMHICCAGGHGDSWNNQCYAIQIPDGSWRRTADQTSWPPDAHIPGGYEPVNRANGLPTAGNGYDESGTYPVSPMINKGIVYKDGKPCSRHIYGGSIWLPVQQRVMLMSGSLWPTGGYDWYCGWFDPSTGTWERKNNVPQGYGGICSAYDSLRNQVLYCINGTQSVYRYDPATDTHTKIGPAGGDPLSGGVGGPYLQVCCDGTCDYLYATVLGGWPQTLPVPYQNAMVRMPLGKTGLQSWQPVNVYGDTTGMFGKSPGFEYDQDRNAFVFWSVGDPANVSILGLADFHISRVAVNGSVPATADTATGVWGRFRRYGANSYCLLTSANAPVNLIKLA